MTNSYTHRCVGKKNCMSIFDNISNFGKFFYFKPTINNYEQLFYLTNNHKMIEAICDT